MAAKIEKQAGDFPTSAAPVIRTYLLLGLVISGLCIIAYRWAREPEPDTVQPPAGVHAPNANVHLPTGMK